MSRIIYVTGGVELLNMVAPLWAELNRHHQSVSEYFSDAFAAFTFEARRQSLIDKAAQGQLRVDLARSESGTEAGYCISSIDAAGTGEVDSLYVRPVFRRQGVGDALMRRALPWMDEERVQSKTIAVILGIEQVLTFYRRYGFFPRIISLKQR
jgi:GNAT superfamily N-acetyltransferase